MTLIKQLQSLKAPSLLSNLLRFQKNLPGGLFNIDVVSLGEELEFPHLLPKELRYAFKKNPGIKPRVAALLRSGKALGVRTVERTPERVLSAINNISTISQHKTITTWLPQLLLTKTKPLFLVSDHTLAAKDDVDLDGETAVILSHRLDFKKFVLVNEASQDTTKEDKRLIDDLNEIISPVVIRHVISRMTFDNADTRTATAQAIIKALLVIGPITHILELYTRGFGKLFAASTDDVLAEAAELFALRGSGFTWKQLIARSRILVPVFALATYGAFQVDPLIENGHLARAGFIFGVSSVALSLTTALQSVRMYKQCIDDLVRDGKLSMASQMGRWIAAIKQDFTNPARLGLIIGSILSPLVAMTIFLWFPQFVHNGWVLAILGTAESLTAGFVVIVARRLNTLRFQLELNRLLRAPSGSNRIA